MRAFIALELPESFVDDLARMARTLGPAANAKLVPRENYHLTLAFLDEIGEAEARSAMAAMDEACAGRPTVPLRAEGLGKFGRAHAAALWLAVAPDPALMGLASAVREALDARGLDFDRKDFVPHVTLARRAKLPREELPQLAFPLPDEGATVTLYRSYLEPEGARYKPLYSVELG